MKQEGKKIEAVKRSVHFVIPNDFKKSLSGSVKNLTREFWQNIDKKTDLRKKLRDVCWTVWTSSGPNTFSMNYLEGTQLIINKSSNKFSFQLKETSGKLTDLNTINFFIKPISEDMGFEQNVRNFNKLWNELITFSEYPSQERPIIYAVADAISRNYKAPLPVTVQAISLNFLPSIISNGLHEQIKKNMPNEVFPEDMVEKAQEAGEIERLTYWTFRVIKQKYQNWQMRKTSLNWRIVNETPGEPEKREKSRL